MNSLKVTLSNHQNFSVKLVITWWIHIVRMKSWNVEWTTVLNNVHLIQNTYAEKKKVLLGDKAKFNTGCLSKSWSHGDFFSAVIFGLFRIILLQTHYFYDRKTFNKYTKQVQKDLDKIRQWKRNTHIFIVKHVQLPLCWTIDAKDIGTEIYDIGRWKSTPFQGSSPIRSWEFLLTAAQSSSESPLTSLGQAWDTSPVDPPTAQGYPRCINSTAPYPVAGYLHTTLRTEKVSSAEVLQSHADAGLTAVSGEGTQMYFRVSTRKSNRRLSTWPGWDWEQICLKIFLLRG